jgi:hypothetical protein
MARLYAEHGNQTLSVQRRAESHRGVPASSALTPIVPIQGLRMAAQAILDIRKIEGYCLDTSHPRGLTQRQGIPRGR